MSRSFAVPAGLSFPVSSTVNENDNKSLSRNQKLGLLVLAVVGAACWLITVWGVIRNFSSTALLDLRVYRDAIELWRTQGQNPYGVYVTEWKLPFTYPPFAILALLPFSLMNFKAAAFSLLAGSFLATAITTWVAWTRGLRGNQLAFFGRFGIVCLVLGFSGVATRLDPFQSTFDYGQVNVMLMVIVCLDLLIVQGRSKGVLLGLAIAIKLTPAVFIAYMIWQRNWRSVWTTLATAALVTGLAGVILPAASIEYWTQTLFATDRIGWAGFIGNQSLKGAWVRIFGDGSLATTMWLLSAVAVLALLWRALKERDIADPNERIRAVAALASAALLISPISWTHHWVWVLVISVALTINARKDSVALLFVTILDLIMVSNLIWQFRIPDHTIDSDWFARVFASNSYVLLTLGILVSLAMGQIQKETSE